MNVTQCDVCGNIVKHEQSVYVHVHKVTRDNKLGGGLAEKELCPTCWDKIAKILLKKGGTKNG